MVELAAAHHHRLLHVAADETDGQTGRRTAGQSACSAVRVHRSECMLLQWAMLPACMRVLECVADMGMGMVAAIAGLCCGAAATRDAMPPDDRNKRKGRRGKRREGQVDARAHDETGWDGCEAGKGNSGSAETAVTPCPRHAQNRQSAG